jgi:lipopolysaccharide/colanic/teichoic acid biosynthesis glycosyltransferase
MSLVGPRPLLPQYLALYSEEQKRRHEIRPGITGWASKWQKCYRLEPKI